MLHKINFQTSCGAQIILVENPQFVEETLPKILGVTCKLAIALDGNPRLSVPLHQQNWIQYSKLLLTSTQQAEKPLTVRFKNLRPPSK